MQEKYNKLVKTLTIVQNNKFVYGGEVFNKTVGNNILLYVDEKDYIMSNINVEWNDKMLKKTHIYIFDYIDGISNHYEVSTVDGVVYEFKFGGKVEYYTFMDGKFLYTEKLEDIKEKKNVNIVADMVNNKEKKIDKPTQDNNKFDFKQHIAAIKEKTKK